VHKRNSERKADRENDVVSDSSNVGYDTAKKVRIDHEGRHRLRINADSPIVISVSLQNAVRMLVLQEQRSVVIGNDEVVDVGRQVDSRMKSCSILYQRDERGLASKGKGGQGGRQGSRAGAEGGLKSDRHDQKAVCDGCDAR
jgi:hypothetical protein